MNSLGHKEVSVGFYDWLIFKTNISTVVQKQYLELLLNTKTDVVTWTLDMEDVDRIFRVKPTPLYQEEQVIMVVQKHGFKIEPLLD